MKETKATKVKFRYRLIYKVVGGLAPLILSKYHFTTERINKTDEPYLVVANHLTEVDMIMLGGAFAKYMRFVAGEHLLRTKNGPRIEWAQGPIYEFKSAAAIDTIREVVRTMKAGTNVMIFPEGSRSFNGETMKLGEGIAKLAKMTGGGLVTYHIQGGYFVAPRWAYTTRTGPMKGHVVNIYSSQEIAAMSRAELTERINEDLYENAYETQRVRMDHYRGERLAEGLENYLVKCPRCGAFDTMLTEGDSFRCGKCGQSGVYTDQGFLKGEGLRFDSVYDWGVWSEKETCAHVAAHERDGPVFSDDDVVLYEVSADHKRTDLGEGTLKGFRDRFDFVGKDGSLIESFPLSDVSGTEMLYFGKTLVFTYKKRHMAVTGDKFHAIKYCKIHEVSRM